MISGFDALRRSTPGGVQATPVHHYKERPGSSGGGTREYDPAYQKLTDVLTELDAELDRLPMGDPTYDDLVTIRGQLLQKKSNIDAAHSQVEGRRKGLESRRKGQSALTSPGLEELERGVIPTPK